MILIHQSKQTNKNQKIHWGFRSIELSDYMKSHHYFSLLFCLFKSFLYLLFIPFLISFYWIDILIGLPILFSVKCECIIILLLISSIIMPFRYKSLLIVYLVLSKIQYKPAWLHGRMNLICPEILITYTWLKWYI